MAPKPQPDACRCAVPSADTKSSARTVSKSVCSAPAETPTEIGSLTWKAKLPITAKVWNDADCTAKRSGKSPGQLAPSPNGAFTDSPYAMRPSRRAAYRYGG